MPTWLPSTEHAVLRWEWLSVQQVTNIEFYVGCADIKVVGTTQAPADFLARVSPLVAIRGTEHLPSDASAYRKAYNGEYGQEYLVGPAVATYNGVIRPSAPPSPSPPPSPPPQPRPPPQPHPPPSTPRTAGTAQLFPSIAGWAAVASHDLSLQRLDDVIQTLSAVVASDSGFNVRAVRSSGGAAGGVVSEGQGYGLLLTGIVAASLPRDHPRRAEILALGFELFLGWKRMCLRTNVNSCAACRICTLSPPKRATPTPLG